MKVNENTKATLTFEQLKGLIQEGRFLNKVKGLDVEDNKLRSQILKDLKTIVDAEEDLSDAQSILNEMPKVDGISWELGENSGPGILYDRDVSQYLDLYGASIEISEGEFDIYYQFNGVPGFGFGTVHFPGIVSFADAIMESKIVEYKALAFTDEDKEIIADAIHQMAMGIPAMLNKVEQLYKNKNMKINESTKVTLTLKQLKRLVKESAEATDSLKDISAFASKAMFFSVLVHFWHLNCDSNSQHLALKDLYESLDDNADKLLEAVIGQTGESAKITNPGFEFKGGFTEESIEQIKAIKEEASKLEATVEGNPGIANVLADIVEDCDSAIYKLTRLQ